MKGDWEPNRGRMPYGAAGKRVKVKLFNGMLCGDKPVSPVTPAGWPADGRHACNWNISNPPHPFEIAEYAIL